MGKPLSATLWEMQQTIPVEHWILLDTQCVPKHRDTIYLNPIWNVTLSSNTDLSIINI
jgi:hypothetical protein